jgi:hypothetical protein
LKTSEATTEVQRARFDRLYRRVPPVGFPCMLGLI